MDQIVNTAVRINRHPGFAPQFANTRQTTVKMRAGFGMNSDPISPSGRIVRQQRVRVGHHQMCIKWLLTVATQGFDQRRAKCQIWYEMPIHDIKMDPVRARFIYRPHLGTYRAEISGQY